jgi:aspartate 1-decarboxylase
MLRKVLYSKIHMATVTGAKASYNGSIMIDPDVLKSVGLRASDAVVVANCRTGARFETYIFVGEPGSKVCEVRGAAAHLVEAGDRVIVMHYALMDDKEYAAHRPRVALMREDNGVGELLRYEPTPG